MLNFLSRQLAIALQYSKGEHWRHYKFVLFEQSSAREMECHLRNWMYKLIDSDLQLFKTEMLVFLVLVFWCHLSWLFVYWLDWLWLRLLFFCLFFLCCISSFSFDLVTRLFGRFLLLVRFCDRKCRHPSCLPFLLDFRNDGFPLGINLIHFLFAFQPFCDLIDRSIDHVDERLQWVFVEWMDFREVGEQEVD